MTKQDFKKQLCKELDLPKTKFATVNKLVDDFCHWNKASKKKLLIATGNDFEEIFEKACTLHNISEDEALSKRHFPKMCAARTDFVRMVLKTFPDTIHDAIADFLDCHRTSVISMAYHSKAITFNPPLKKWK